ncbi:MAG: nucleotide exchange factor GrpE [Wenzhouxiangella sp.]
MSDNKNPTDASSPGEEAEERHADPAPESGAGNGAADRGDEHAASPDPESESNEGAGEAEEIGRLREALLRTRAEMDNLQKRAERELDKARKFATESLLKDLVPVIDSLDQGMESGDGDHEGMTLTRKLLLDTLTRHGLEMIDPAGQPFDPQWHEAMSMQPSEEHAPDTVLMVLQKGYSLKGRVVRPARVIVSR